MFFLTTHITKKTKTKNSVGDNVEKGNPCVCTVGENVNWWSHHGIMENIMYLVAQSCPTLCDPMDCSPPGSSVHGDSPDKNTGVGCPVLLQRIFPNLGSNPHLLNCRWILYCLSHQGSQEYWSG